MSDLSKLIGDLAPEQQELFLLRLARLHRERAAAPETIRPQPRTTNTFPLSFAQQRLWFLDQLAPGSSLYNVPAAVQLTGRLDPDALASALDAVVRRHEALRTTFVIAEGQPAQVIAPALSLPLPLIDLQGCPSDRRQAEIERLVVAEASAPFDLARGPLIRAQLVRLAADEHLLLLTIHHIVSDGWSMGVLVRELGAFYSAHVQGRPAELPPLPLQYADYSIWQREWLQGAVLDEQLAYWKRQLAGIPPVLELPTDRPRPAFQTLRGARLPIAISPAVTATLAELGRQAGATLFMTLLAAFQTLLFRYSGQTDIVIGTPIANRTRTEIEGLIGFFVNTLVLRARLAGADAFQALLEQVRTVVLEAQQHQDLPFEKLVEELQPVRNPSHHPLFQVMCVLQNVPLGAIELHGLTMRPVDAYNETAKFDLWLGMVEEANGLTGQLEYNSDLFDAATIVRLRGHFLTLLDGIVADPRARLASLPLLTPAERRQLLVEWNATAATFSPEQCIHTLFEAQAARTPDALALVFDATNDERRTTTGADSAFSLQMTYAELERRANQLAHHLRSLGVEVGMRVGISMPRGLEMVVGLFGILKAGAAYVPIDPALPPDRLAFMIDNSRARVLLTTTDDRRPTTDDSETRRQEDKEMEHAPISLSPGLLVSLSIVDLARDWPSIARQPTTNLDAGVAPGDLGYVIYTSGSTGVPKGVAMSHRALVNLLEWQLEYLGHRQGTRFLQFASLSFDVSYQEIFPTLASGGTVVLITEELRRDAYALWRLLAREQVERIYLPYVGLQQLAEAAEQPGPAPAHLRQITVSGEQLQITRQIINMVRKLNLDKLHNFYGPSESHAVTAHTLTGAPEDWPTLVPIGRPIANTQMYILDQHMQPVPAGIPGELYIGGVCLADGYLHRPDLTAERFVPNPFGTMNDERGTMNEATLASSFIVHRSSFGTRLYKTGDLTRYRPNGSIVFLGRIDHQVKVRGFRVELEEIATVLTQHPAVLESVVVVREDRPGDKRLVAYVVLTTDDRRPTTEEGPDRSVAGGRWSVVGDLRTFLKQQLPDYMVPSAFVVLDALPLTINRKVDRAALPAPDPSHAGRETLYVAPQTETERELAAIWADLLHVKQVGRHDNFFELGGHSLLATQMVAQVRQRIHLELPLRSLFEAPTIAELAGKIEALRVAALHLQAPLEAPLGDEAEEGEI